MSEENQTRVILPNYIVLVSTTPMAKFKQHLREVSFYARGNAFLEAGDSNTGAPLRRLSDTGVAVPRARSVKDFVSAVRSAGVGTEPWYWRPETVLPSCGWVTPVN